MERISINATIYDLIERIIYHNNNHINYYSEIRLDNRNSKEEFIEAFKKCVDFQFENDIDESSIIFTLKKEYDSILSDMERNYKHYIININNLRSHYNRLLQKNDNSIEDFLKFKKLDWLLNIIKQPSIIL